MGASGLDGIISEKVNALLQGRNDITLLEGGCGSGSYFRFANVARSTGIDISEEQLRLNAAVQERILGDLQTYPLPSGAFDIVVCWDVIEHLPKPRQALLNMFGALKPGGVLVLGFPNLASFKGLVTKFTPFWLHCFLLRRLGYGSDPFPTCFRLEVLPKRVIRFAEERGLSVVFNQLVEGGVTKRFKSRFPFLAFILQAADACWRALTLGKCQSLFLDNCALVLRKGQPAGSLPGDSVATATHELTL